MVKSSRMKYLICNQMQLVFVIIILLISLAKGQQRIIGGCEAPLRFGLFHASLQNLAGDHVCGGAVVSRWHVITAAHCLYEAEPDYIKVVVGTTNLNKGGIKHEAELISFHKKFNHSSKVNDIGLVKVKTPFDLNHVRIIKLYENDVADGDIVFLSGFGAQKLNGTSSSQMHVLTIPVFNQEICKYALRYTREVADCMFCTFTEMGQGTCRGDSGSPIIKDDKLVGLVSWGIPCARGFPDVHVRITPYIEWVRGEIKNNCRKKTLQFLNIPVTTTTHINTTTPVTPSARRTTRTTRRTTRTTRRTTRNSSTTPITPTNTTTPVTPSARRTTRTTRRTTRNSSTTPRSTSTTPTNTTTPVTPSARRTTRTTRRTTTTTRRTTTTTRRTTTTTRKPPTNTTDPTTPY